jgi:hypothetical protein
MKKARFVTISLLCFLVCALSVGAVENEADSAADDSGTEINAEGQDSGKASDKEADDELRLTAGYDKAAMNGFFIRSEDGSFRLNIGAYTQPRYDVNWRDAPAGEDDVSSDFSIRRTRFFFEGNYTPVDAVQLRQEQALEPSRRSAVHRAVT